MRIEGKHQRLLLNLNMIPHGLKKIYSLLFLRRSDDRLQAQLVQFLEPEVGVDLQVEKFMPGVGVARVRDITVSPRTRIAFNFEAGKHPR